MPFQIWYNITRKVIHMAQRIPKKGQIVLPAKLRKKFQLEPGGMVKVEEENGHITVIPLAKDPIAKLYGILKGPYSLTEDLLTERRLEEKLEAKLLKRTRIHTV
jgi:AbrB family looped-hinge helix DNA binding protein